LHVAKLTTNKKLLWKPECLIYKKIIMLVSKNLPEVSQTGNVASNQSTSAFPSEIYAILGGSSYGHVIYDILPCIEIYTI